MIRNGIAANLLMWFLIAAGVLAVMTMPQESLPEVSLDRSEVRVEYPGADPAEVERSLVRPIEDAVAGVVTGSRLRSTAAGNVGVVRVELGSHADIREGLDRVRAAVARVTSLPSGAEEPVVTAPTSLIRAMEIALFGDVPARTLKELAHQVRGEIASLPAVSLAEVHGVRAYEISVEVPNDALRHFGLTLEDVAGALRRGAVDLASGSLKAADEEILVRVEGNRQAAADLGSIVVRAVPGAQVLRLDDLATITDGFRDSDIISAWNGRPAAFVRVFRTGDEQVLQLAAAVGKHLRTHVAPGLPEGVDYAIVSNRATELEGRISLLARNGLTGLLLVLLALALTLDLRLALWTAAGIFVSFTGAFGVLGALGGSINMISLFAFILGIGIVVDDAIVVGESIHGQRNPGTAGSRTAERGVLRVAVPVVFGVLTTVAAFTPLLFVPGNLGNLFQPIPVVVIAVLLLSLLESLFVLPYHLSHLRATGPAQGALPWLHHAQERIQDALHRFVEGPLEAVVAFAVRRWGLVLAACAASLILVGGLVAGRQLRVNFFPEVVGDQVFALIRLPVGTPSKQTLEVAREVERAGWAAVHAAEASRSDAGPPLVRGSLLSVGVRPSAQYDPQAVTEVEVVQPNIAEVGFQLAPASSRTVSAFDIERAWRDSVGAITGTGTVTFNAQLVNLGSAVQIELSHAERETLDLAASELVERLRSVTGVTNVGDDRARGQREVEIRLRPVAQAIGVTSDDLARQVRAALFGVEALRLQRDREETRVYVRLPPEERDAPGDLLDYWISTPSGSSPLSTVASLSHGTSNSVIRRVDGSPTVTVTAGVDRTVSTAQDVTDLLTSDILTGMSTAYPGLRHAFGGERREQSVTYAGMARGFALALLVIYAMLAIPLRSYTQPLLVMAAIPLGLIGAVLGHLVMGLDLGLMSVFGLVGLSGVVVNDSLVLMDRVNRFRRAGASMSTAIVQGSKARFRPILLTSVTTFLGLTPILLERATQAQFLKPMAASIGFGILLTTVVIMLAVPALIMMNHVVLESVRIALGGRRG